MFNMPELNEFDSGKDMNRKWTKSLEGKVVVDVERLERVLHGLIVITDMNEGLSPRDVELKVGKHIAYLTQGEDNEST